MKPTPFKERLLQRHVKTEAGCWEWTGCCNNDGYGLIGGPRVNGRSRAKKTHRAAYEAFVGPIADGLSVLHRCDNRKCINPDHLYLGTQAQNVKDMAERNQRRWDSVRLLTDEQVKEIKKSVGEKQEVLARRFGVKGPTIALIRMGRTYKHVS